MRCCAAFGRAEGGCPPFSIPPGRYAASHPPRGHAPRPAASPQIEAPKGGRTEPPTGTPPPELLASVTRLPPLLVRGGVPPPCQPLRGSNSTPLGKGYALPPPSAAPPSQRLRRWLSRRRGCPSKVVIDRKAVDDDAKEGGVTAAADLANVHHQARQNRPGGPIMATGRGWPGQGRETRLRGAPESRPSARRTAFCRACNM